MSAWSAEIDGDKVSFQRKEVKPKMDAPGSPLPDGPPPPYDLGEYDYQGGQF